MLGRGGLAMNVMSVGGALMFMTFAGLAATSPHVSGAEVLRESLLFGLLMSGFLLAGTMSIAGHGRDLVLVGVFRTTTLPVEDFVEASGDDGLVITRSNGETLGHVGYGSSLLGLLTGNRRSTAVAGRITEWACSVREMPLPRRAPRTTTSAVRGAAWLVVPVGTLGLCAAASAVHALAV